VKWARNAAGAFMPMNQKSAAATRNAMVVRKGDDGAAPAPCPCAAFSGTAAGLAAGGLAGGAAVGLGAGGGPGMLPSLITVVPRITSSSMLTLNLPSLLLHSSSLRRRRLVA